MPHIRMLCEFKMKPSTLSLRVRVLLTILMCTRINNRRLVTSSGSRCNVLGRVVLNTKHPSLQCTLAGYALMLRGCIGPLMSNILFPTGTTDVMNALNLSTSICFLLILEHGVLLRKLLSFTSVLKWPGTSKGEPT
jgi:hypothetical protein